MPWARESELATKAKSSSNCFMGIRVWAFIGLEYKRYSRKRKVIGGKNLQPQLTQLPFLFPLFIFLCYRFSNSIKYGL